MLIKINTILGAAERQKLLEKEPDKKYYVLSLWEFVTSRRVHIGKSLNIEGEAPTSVVGKFVF